MKSKIIAMTFMISVTLSCQNSQNNQQNQSNSGKISTQDYVQTGDKIVAESFKSLSSNLMTAMKAGGVRGASGYCHLEAQPLTDSLSNQFNVEIRRVALKYRNPQNALGEKDEAVFKDYEASNQLQARLDTTQDNVVYYKPILLAKPCLKCHGAIGEDVMEEDYVYLTELYPDDRAIGFKEGDLRGLWKITFNEVSNHKE